MGKEPQGASEGKRQKVEKVVKEPMMEKVLSSTNLKAAYKAVKRNGGAAGIDGKSIKETEQHLKEVWPLIREKLKAGTYVPSPVKGVKIPKPDGGERLLGIPTVQDRIIQQALQQVLSDQLDDNFSEHSYGFRRERSAHDAVKAAQSYIQEGKSWVVDIDISAFFDCVNHDILMSRISREVECKQVLRLIRKYLKAGLVIEGEMEKRHCGTPQGGPLSPLLANIYLDKLDKELEMRELSFCRYADDINIYVGSERSAERILKSLSVWIEKHLKLSVNSKKSGTGRPWERQFLGFRIRKAGKIAIAPKSVERYKAKVRLFWDACKSIAFVQLVSRWQKYIRGWWNYYQLSDTPWLMGKLGSWTRRHIRKYFWQRWHNKKGRLNALKQLGAKWYHLEIASSSRGAWRIAGSPALHTVLNNSALKRFGLYVPSDLSAR